MTPKAMTLNNLEHQNRGFYGFYICSQWAFIHALLSRVPFALAGLSCLYSPDGSTFLCHCLIQETSAEYTACHLANTTEKNGIVGGGLRCVNSLLVICVIPSYFVKRLFHVGYIATFTFRARLVALFFATSGHFSTNFNCA